MSDFDLIEIDGELHGTGLRVPEHKPTTFALYADQGPMLTREQIQKLASDPNRFMGRKRFGASFIKSQGSRGSCNGYSGAKALERARVLRGLPHVALSGEGLYAQINGGRDSGSMLDDGMKAITDNGVPPESMVKHQTYLWRDISSEAREAMKQFKAFECYRCETEEELASGLASGFVGVVAVHASGAWSRLDSRGVSGASHGPGNHSVGVDDIRIAPDGGYEFDHFNSWGTRWGEQGRSYLRWDRHFRQTIRYHAFYLIRSSIDGQQGGPL